MWDFCKIGSISRRCTTAASSTHRPIYCATTRPATSACAEVSCTASRRHAAGYGQQRAIENIFELGVVPCLHYLVCAGKADVPLFSPLARRHSIRSAARPMSIGVDSRPEYVSPIHKQSRPKLQNSWMRADGELYLAPIYRAAMRISPVGRTALVVFLTGKRTIQECTYTNYMSTSGNASKLASIDRRWAQFPWEEKSTAPRLALAANGSFYCCVPRKPCGLPISLSFVKGFTGDA